MDINSSLLGLIVSYIDERFDIRLDYPKTEGNTLSGKVDNVEVEINIEFIRNEATGEVLDIMLYSDDVPEVNDVSIDRDDTDTDDIYEELNNDESGLSDYLDDEDDDSEDRGHSL